MIYINGLIWMIVYSHPTRDSVECGKPNAINLPFGDGFNPTQRHGDDLGMIYGIGFTTLPRHSYPWEDRNTLQCHPTWQAGKPQTKWRLGGKIITEGFSSQPCLITRGYVVIYRKSSRNRA